MKAVILAIPIINLFPCIACKTCNCFIQYYVTVNNNQTTLILINPQVSSTDKTKI